MRKYKSIFFLTADPTKNAGSLKEYFVNNTEEFVAFHFFPGYVTSATYAQKYINGKLVTEKTCSISKGKNTLVNTIIDYLFFSYILLFFVKRESLIIVNAPFFLFFNGIFKLLKSFKFIFWIGDFYPQKDFPMNIYHLVVNYFNATVDYVVYLSPPLKAIYASKRKNKAMELVPLGVKMEKSSSRSILKGKTHIAFIGIIREQQGLDLFFSFLKENDQCILEVVGDGYKLEYYKKLAKEMRIEKKVIFHGRVEDVSSIFARCHLGIALYKDDPMNLSIYCEPTKIKQYLSYGLPVITTKTTYFSKELEEFHAGYVVDENEDSVKNGIEKILKHYESYRSGVLDLVTKYEYSKWYDKKLYFLKK